MTYSSSGILYLRIDVSNDGMGRAAIVALECEIWGEKTAPQLSTTFLPAGEGAYAVVELPTGQSHGSDGIVTAKYVDAFNRTFCTIHKLHLDPDAKGLFTCTFLGEEQTLLA